MHLLFAVHVALAAWLSSPTPASDLLEVPDFSTTTPPAWGKPLLGGPIRVVFCAPVFTLGDAARLQRELDVELRPAPVYTTALPWLDANQSGPMPSMAQDEVLARLTDSLEGKLDVVVLGNVDLASLPDDIHRSILDRVQGGAGLVLTFPGENMPEIWTTALAELVEDEESAYITRGLGAALLPEWADGLSFVRAGKYGEGRIVFLDFPTGPAETHCLLPRLEGQSLLQDEYHGVYTSLAMRAVRWAAGRMPDVTMLGAAYVGAEAPDEAEIPPIPREYEAMVKEQAVHQPSREYVLQIAEPAPSRYDVVTQLRRPGPKPPVRLARDESQPPFAKGISAFPHYVVAGPGTYLHDMWLLDKGRVVDWYTDVVTLDHWPKIRDIDFSDPLLRPYGRLGIAIDSVPRMYRARRTALYARAIDPIGRVVGEGRGGIEADSEDALLQLDLLDVVTNRVNIEVFAVERDDNLDIESDLLFASGDAFSFPVAVGLAPDRFFLGLQWLDDLEPNVVAHLRTLHKAGADVLFMGPEVEQSFLASDVGLYPIPHAALRNDETIDSALAMARRQGIAHLWTDVPESIAFNALANGHVFAAAIDSPLALARTRHAAPPGAELWMHTEAGSEAEARLIPWHAALEGYRGLIYDSPLGTRSDVPLSAAITPAGVVRPPFTAIAESAEALRTGIDGLLSRVQRPAANVSIFDSGEDGTIDSWYAVLRALGYAVDLLSPGDVSEIDAYSVVILPAARYLSDGEIAALSGFAEAGGALIADDLPGAFDERGAARTHNPFLSLFGLTDATESGTGEPAPVTLFNADGSERVLDRTTAPYRAPTPEGAVFGGQAGGLGIWIQYQSDTRRTLLLNHPLQQAPKEAAALIQACIDASGGLPGDAFDEADPYTPHADRYLFGLGNARIHAVVCRPGQGGFRGTLERGDGHHLFDILQGLRLPGRGKERVRVEEGAVGLFAELPYDVSSLELIAAEECVAGQRIQAQVDVKTVGALPGEHPIHVTLRPIGFPPLRHYSHNVVFNGTPVPIAIQLALNETPGWYELEVRDVLSGLRSSARIQVMAR